MPRPMTLGAETVAALFRIPDFLISDFGEYDPGCAIRFTIFRDCPTGSSGDPDILGAQQYAPLLDIEVPTG
jgi:Domain of unknown function (DUF4387)